MTEKEKKEKKEAKAKKKEPEKTQVKKEEKKHKDEPREKKDFLPPLDLISIVLPFYTQALVNLGQTEDLITKKKEENLDLAKRLIDILDLLKEKTEGNLKPEEEKFLTNAIHQLKMIYMQKTETIKV